MTYNVRREMLSEAKPMKLTDDQVQSRRNGGHSKTDAELTAFVEQCKGDPEAWFVFSEHISQSGASNRASRLKSSERYGKLPLRWRSHTTNEEMRAVGAPNAVVVAQYAIEKDSNPRALALPQPWFFNDDGKVWYFVEAAEVPFAVTIAQRSDGSVYLVDTDGNVQ